MNRRDLLKKCLFSLGTLALLQLSSLENSMASVVLKALPGKLGYREVSKFPNKKCQSCKHYKADSGECVLAAMRNVMKANVVLVEPQAHCNMWAKI